MLEFYKMKKKQNPTIFINPTISVCHRKSFHGSSNTTKSQLKVPITTVVANLTKPIES
jgi:hypothetical protein